MAAFGVSQDNDCAFASRGYEFQRIINYSVINLQTHSFSAVSSPNSGGGATSGLAHAANDAMSTAQQPLKRAKGLCSWLIR